MSADTLVTVFKVLVGLLLVVGAVVYVFAKARQRSQPAAGASVNSEEDSMAAGFSAERDIVIKYFDGDKQVTQGESSTPPLRVITDGLAKHDRPEFELIGVPVSLNNAAAMLLNRIAEYTVNKKHLKSGDTWASRLPDGFVVAARVQAAESFGHQVLRICDVSDERCNEPAKTAVCAVAVSDARAKHEGDQVEDATRILNAAIGWFPGEPGPGVRIQKNENINQNNNLAYFALAAMHVDVEKNYVAAVQRSEDLMLAELGSAQPPVVGRETLEKDALAIVTAVQDEMDRMQGGQEAQLPTGEHGGDGIGFLLSPIVRFVGDELRQFLAIGPSSYRRYFYEPPARDALREPRVAKLAAEIYAKWVGTPEMVLLLSRDTAVDVYEEGYRFEDERQSKAAPKIATQAADRQHLPLLSRILASLGRELAAGLSVDEIRTRWKLDDDSARASSAVQKLAALRKREDQDIMKSYGFQK